MPAFRVSRRAMHLGRALRRFFVSRLHGDGRCAALWRSTSDMSRPQRHPCVPMCSWSSLIRSGGDMSHPIVGHLLAPFGLDGVVEDHDLHRAPALRRAADLRRSLRSSRPVLWQDLRGVGSSVRHDERSDRDACVDCDLESQVTDWGHRHFPRHRRRDPPRPLRRVRAQRPDGLLAAVRLRWIAEDGTLQLWTDRRVERRRLGAEERALCLRRNCDISCSNAKTDARRAASEWSACAEQ